jgi:hypothetical protein
MRQFIGVITLAQIAAPTAPTATLAAPAAPGNIENGAHSYKVTFVAGATETEGGAQSAPVTVVDKTANGQVELTDIPVSPDSGVTARNLYRTIAGADPAVAANYLLLDDIADNTTTTFTDNLADGSLGAPAPTTNDTVAGRFPVPLSETLAAAGLDQGVAGLAFLQIAEVGSGNLVITTDPDIAAETDGYPIGDSANPLVLATSSGAMSSDVISTGNLYLYSTTAGKQAAIIARAKI